MTETGTYVRSPLFSERGSLRAEERQGFDLPGYALMLAVAAAVFLAAFDYGTYNEVNRTTLAIGGWWAVVLAVVLGFRSLVRMPQAALTVAGLLLGLAVWTLASTQWAASAEKAFAELDRVVLYLGVFLVVLILSPRATAGRWADGIALGIALTGLLALTTRLFPDIVSTNDFDTVLTSAYARLSYPLGYWNGLAIFCGIGFPLLLRAAIESRFAVLRGLSLAALPALVAVIYLASSRGGFAVAIFGTFCYLLLAPKRWTGLAAAGLAGIAAIGVIAVLQARSELVNNPALPAADGQGSSAALLILLLCALVAVLWAAGTVLLSGRLPENPSLERVALAVIAVIAVVGLIAARPIHRFEQFKALPAPATVTAGSDQVETHLLSKSGSGRWQLWSAAMDEFDSERLHGRGAGSFEAWYLRSPHFAGFARDAHSLYAETLGELGIIGLALLALTFLAGAAAGLRRALAGAEAAAAIFAAFLGYALGAAVDWVWELTAVTLVAVGLLALMTGPATLPRRLREGRVGVGRRVALATTVGVVALGLLAVGVEGLALSARLKIDESQAAVSRDDPVAAIDAALGARSIEPWAASPYLQLALVEEQTGNLAAARGHIDDAIDRDDVDWRLWLTKARIEAKLGNGAAARRAYARARSLNPNSSLFAQTG